MRKIYLFLLLGLSALSLNAQIVITSSDMPGANDTLRYSESNLDTLTLATYQNTGTNYTWNFAHLNPTNQGVAQYKAALQTPYAFFFFGPNKYGLLQADTIGVAAFQFTNVYQFFNKTTSVFEVEGLGATFQGIPIPNYYSDKDEIYQFPLAYGDQDSTTFAFSLNFLAFGAYYSAGYRKNTVDGWGQITTPYGTFDCIRVVSEIVSTDSVALGALNFGFDNVRLEYKWLAKNIEIPILEITGTSVAGVFTPNAIRYRDIYRNIQDPVSPFAPTASFDANNLNPTTLDTVVFTAEPALLSTYEWSFTPNTVAYVNGTNSTSEVAEVVFQAAGLYDVQLTVTNFFGSGDSLAMDYINVSWPVNTVNLSITNGFSLFPNPTQGSIHLAYDLSEGSQTTFQLFDLQGRNLATLLNAEEVAGKQEHQFDLTALQLPRGVYLLHAQIQGQRQWFRLAYGK